MTIVVEARPGGMRWSVDSTSNGDASRPARHHRPAQAHPWGIAVPPGAHLIGVYLHGSLAFGCFHPAASDLDLLVVVAGTLDVATRRRIIQDLIAWSGEAPAKGLELSIITQASVQAFQHPTPFELHFSNAWRERYLADAVDLAAERTDPDLAAHLMVVRERGVCLFEAPVAAILPSIPSDAYLDAIASDALEACTHLASDPVYGVLNSCRVLAFLHEGRITSKAEGGDWGVQHLAAAFIPLVQAAREAYLQATPLHVVSEELLEAFAAYATQEIVRARAQGSRAERRKDDRQG